MRDTINTVHEYGAPAIEHDRRRFLERTQHLRTIVTRWSELQQNAQVAAMATTTQPQTSGGGGGGGVVDSVVDLASMATDGGARNWDPRSLLLYLNKCKVHVVMMMIMRTRSIDARYEAYHDSHDNINIDERLSLNTLKHSRALARKWMFAWRWRSSTDSWCIPRACYPRSRWPSIRRHRWWARQ